MRPTELLPDSDEGNSTVWVCFKIDKDPGGISRLPDPVRCTPGRTVIPSTTRRRKGGFQSRQAFLTRQHVIATVRIRRDPVGLRGVPKTLVKPSHLNQIRELMDPRL